MLNLVTNSPFQTKKFGEVLAKQVLKTRKREKALVIGLIGGLGGGKTTFLQGFAKGLNIPQRILSSTFVIMKKFEIPKNSNFRYFYHFDCYRIEDKKEILALGFSDIINDPKNIVAIEWAERTKKIIPEDAIILKFKFLEKNKRLILLDMFSKG